MSSVLQLPAEMEIQEVKAEEVIQLFGSKDGVSTQELSGTGFSYRHDWGDRKGQWILPLNWGAVNRNSRVFVAIGEGASGGGKFIGSARFTLHNVAPQDGRVSIWVNIEWGEPIRLYVDYLVINP
ncbi:hypothetical protein [Microseira wollei]|uniref:Uncharacterized protein n=1 Tax=Microseira wollei NIES-4236 TaxID=2530354 RepID=A0AAV3XC39_9CYAN|nr:hypothetical protein [Microseira wollei]GET37979.1 hypothetical protein MiSe_27330 [Microseira wollei NIES-4236]